MENISELIAYFNQSGGIPLAITQVNQQTWSQFGIMLATTLLGSIFIFIFLWNAHLKPIFASFIIKKNLQKIRVQTGRPIVIIKHTTSGLFSRAMIDDSTVQSVISALNKLGGKPFDLVLYTPGGTVFSSMYIARILKNYPSEVRAIVPVYAMSGGTLIALACDKIALGDYACLGAVDPQLGSFFGFGSARSWSKIVKFKGKKSDDHSVNMAFMGKQYTDLMAEFTMELVQDKMSPKKAEALVEYLTSGGIAHGHPLTADKLESLGLQIGTIHADTNKMLMKILSSKLYEGVYVVK